MTSWSWTSFRAVLWAWSRRCRRTVPCRAATRETAALRRLDLYRDDDEPAGSPPGTLTLHTDLPQDGALREVPVQPHLNVTYPLDPELSGHGQELDPVPVPEVH